MWIFQREHQNLLLHVPILEILPWNHNDIYSTTNTRKDLKTSAYAVTVIQNRKAVLEVVSGSPNAKNKKQVSW